MNCAERIRALAKELGVDELDIPAFQRRAMELGQEPPTVPAAGEPTQPDLSSTTPNAGPPTAEDFARFNLEPLKGRGLGEVGAVPMGKAPSEAGWWAGAKRMYITSMISGIPTLYKIAASNPVYAWWKMGAANVLAPKIDWILRGITGVVGKEPLGAALGKAATKRGFASGIEDMKRIALGEPPLLGKDIATGAFNVREDIGPWKRIPVVGPIGQAAVSIISRTHGMLHRLGWSNAYQYGLISRAQILAKNAFPNLSGTEFTARVMRLVNNPTPEMDAYATEWANEATLLNKNFVSEAFAKGVQGARQLGTVPGAAADVAATAVMPFARIGPNLIIQGLRNTPAGFPMALPDIVRLVKARYFSDTPLQGDLLDQQRGYNIDDVSRLQGRVAERLAEAGAGTASAFALGALGTKLGYIAPGAARSKEEKAWMDANGIPPFGINIGKLMGREDDYRSALQLLGPLGVAMEMGAAWHEAASNPQHDLYDMASTVTQPIAEEQTLTGLREAGQAVQAAAQGQLSHTKSAVTQFAEQRAVAAIPAAIQQLARQMDPIVRDPQTFAEVLRTALPISHEDIPPKVGSMGLPRVRQTSPYNPLPKFPSEGVPLSFSKPILDMYARISSFDSHLSELNRQLQRAALIRDPAARDARIQELSDEIARRVQLMAGQQQ